MMREKILTVLLIISLGANAYLIFFDHSSLNHGIPGVISSGLFPASGNMSNVSLSYEDASNNSTLLSPNASTEDPLLTELPPEEPVEEMPPPTPEDTDEVTEEPTPVSDGWANYSSAKNGFSLRYPQTWEINEKSTGSPRAVLIMTAPVENECDRTGTQCYKYIASMTIELDKDPFTLVPEEYFNKAVAAFQDEYSITTTSKSAACIVSGSRAYQIEFYTRDERGNPDRSYMQYYCFIDGKVYIISYTGPFSNWENVYSRNRSDAVRIIDSIVFVRDYREA